VLCPFDKIGLKALFNRFGAESPKKALVLLLKEQEMSWSLNTSYDHKMQHKTAKHYPYLVYFG